MSLDSRVYAMLSMTARQPQSPEARWSCPASPWTKRHDNPLFARRTLTAKVELRRQGLQDLNGCGGPS